MSKKISDILPDTEILAQAALKLRRALDGTNPTPKSVAECEKNLHEEFGDILNCILALTYDNEDLYYKFIADCQVNCIPKMQRRLSRLEAKERSNE